jgi:hypothetical protein
LNLPIDQKIDGKMFEWESGEQPTGFNATRKLKKISDRALNARLINAQMRKRKIIYSRFYED